MLFFHEESSEFCLSVSLPLSDIPVILTAMQLRAKMMYNLVFLGIFSSRAHDAPHSHLTNLFTDV